MKTTLILHATLEIDCPTKDVARALAGLAALKLEGKDDSGPLGAYEIALKSATVSEIRGPKK